MAETVINVLADVRENIRLLRKEHEERLERLKQLDDPGGLTLLRSAEAMGLTVAIAHSRELEQMVTEWINQRRTA